MNAVRTAIIFVLAVSFVTLMPWRAVRAIAASADLTDPPTTRALPPKKRVEGDLFPYADVGESAG